jgi:hypothetical protein
MMIFCPVSIAGRIGVAFAVALGATSPASAESTVLNINVFGPPRALTAGIEAIAQF